MQSNWRVPRSARDERGCAIARPDPHRWYARRMTIQIAVRIPERDVSALDDAIARGRFPNRAAAVREGLELLLHREREREIDEVYRRGYRERPQEEAVGDAGLAAFAAFVASEESGADPL